MWQSGPLADVSGWRGALQESQVIGVNAELFSRDTQNVPMLLGLLEEEPVGVADFHVRYHALQILTGLSSSPHRLQEVRPCARSSPLPLLCSALVPRPVFSRLHR